jgi:hypothetical protein
LGERLVEIGLQSLVALCPNAAGAPLLPALVDWLEDIDHRPERVLDLDTLIARLRGAMPEFCHQHGVAHLDQRM